MTLPAIEGDAAGDTNERAPLVLVPTAFGCLLYERRTARYFPFDALSAVVLETLRTRSPAAVAAAARPLVEALHRRGLLTPDGRLPADRLPLEPLAARGLTGPLAGPLAGPLGGPLAGPLALHLEVTQACDLRCAHCFADAGPRSEPALVPAVAPEPELTSTELDALFAELAGLGTFRLGLTGGEPTLRPDLLEIIDAALARGLAPCLTTNGRSLDATLARELGRRPLLWLNLSFDGATAATHDRLRGPGSFARALAAAGHLAGRARFSLAFTLWSGNLEEVEACVTLARSLGAEAAVFRPLYPVGRARDGALQPSFADYQHALDRLATLAAVRTDEALATASSCELCAGVEAFAPSTREAARASLAGQGCGAARLVASVSATGRVSPCSFLGADFVAGSLRERSFAELWRDGESFRRLRCPARAGGFAGGFAGGCRARSLALAGDAGAADPWLVAERRHPSATLSLELATSTVQP